MKLKATSIAILLLAGSLFFASCGKKKDDEKSSKEVDGVKGQWNGFLVEINDKALDDEQMPMTLQFDKDNKFQLNTGNDSNGYATGTYTIFSTSILFSITYSNISVFGLSNTIVDIDYSQYGTGLLLKSENFQIKALFDKKLKNGISAPTGDRQNKTNGAWEGYDNNDNKWLLMISATGTFEASVQHPQNKSLTIAGSSVFKEESKTEGFLLIETSNQQKSVGRKIFFQLVDSTTIHLKILIDGSSSPQEFDLNHHQFN